MSGRIRQVPPVTPWARELVPLRDRVWIKALVEEIGDAYYSISAETPHGPLIISVRHRVGTGTAAIVEMRGDPEVILPRAIEALEAWIAVSEGALDGVSVR